MLIVSQFLPTGDLQLDAYTHSNEEFAAVETTLIAAQIQPTYQILEPDRANRGGRRYTARSREVAKLEAVLEGTFRVTGQFIPAGGTGRNYACREIALRGKGKRCKDLIAPNYAAAQTKCALIAGTNNWLGGVPNPGKCP